MRSIALDIVTIVNATKKYGEHVVLDDVSLSFEQGLIHGITGRNGCGKTVLLKAICGFVPLSSGSVTVGGKRIGKDTDVPKDVGIIIEAPGFLPLYSALGNLRLLANIRGKATKEQQAGALERVGLDPQSRQHVGKFSLGMRQRLGIAQAIMEDPALLILDEPFNGLDIAGVEDMRQLLLELREHGKTILMASHSREDLVLLCDTVCQMDRGRIVAKDGGDGAWAS
jgi:ABC-2 type transport system ATP-binding protein